MPIGDSVTFEGQVSNIIAPPAVILAPGASGIATVLASGGPLFSVIIKNNPSSSTISGIIWVGGTGSNMANALSGTGLAMTPDDSLLLKVNNFNKISLHVAATNSGTFPSIIGLQSP